MKWVIEIESPLDVFPFAPSRPRPGLMREEEVTPAGILRALSKVLDGEERWTKGSPARDAEGLGVHGTHPRAVSWCIAGGLQRTLGLSLYTTYEDVQLTPRPEPWGSISGDRLIGVAGPMITIAPYPAFLAVDSG